MVMFVNRLTPPSYPATLKNVQIYFGNRPDGLQAGASIAIVLATNPSGSAAFSASSAGTFRTPATTVLAAGAFNTYSLSQPITIDAGDFVVGFKTGNPAGIYPAAQDRSTPSQGRSYVSTDGKAFDAIDSISAGVARGELRPATR